MNKEIATKWVQALRSGKYSQTQGQLRNDNDFCCLGVLCNLHAEEHPEIASKQKTKFEYLGHEADLPDEVVMWADMDNSNGEFENGKGQRRSLIMYNDHEAFTFKQIAGIIERNWERL